MGKSKAILRITSKEPLEKTVCVLVVPFRVNTVSVREFDTLIRTVTRKLILTQSVKKL